MPAYNFKKQFAGDVERGAKNQTIRPKRKRSTRSGDKLYLYTGMRTKQCRKLREAICISVEPIEILPASIRINGRILGVPEMWELAQADGFEKLGHFYDFFREHYGVPHDIELELIKW